MKALVFHRPGKVSVDNVPDPKIEKADDAILRITSTAICGSDLHIYNGFLPQASDMILGHEFMGVVEEVGSGVTELQRGDRVVVPFPIACGGCFFDELLMWVEEGRIQLDDIITHRLPLAEAPHGYQIFNKKEDGCVKVVLKP